MLEYGIEQRTHIGTNLLQVHCGVTVERRGIYNREIQLVFTCAQLVEQIEGVIYYPVGTCTGAVNLVDNHDRTQSQR